MATDRDVTRLLDDYIGLYARETLELWCDLLLPGFIATSTNEDGSLTTRSRDEFYERQRGLFATGKPVREVLENTKVVRNGDLAFVGSDFVWSDGETARRGRLMLLLMLHHGKFGIQALTFSYHV